MQYLFLSLRDIEEGFCFLCFCLFVLFSFSESLFLASAFFLLTGFDFLHIGGSPSLSKSSWLSARY